MILKAWWFNKTANVEIDTVLICEKSLGVHKKKYQLKDNRLV